MDDTDTFGAVNAVRGEDAATETTAPAPGTKPEANHCGRRRHDASGAAGVCRNVSRAARSRPPAPRSNPYLRRLVAFGEECILSPYVPHSWWDDMGRRVMVKRLLAKGFPNLWGWLFLTLTVDPSKFADTSEAPAELVAFITGKDRIRRVIAALRETYTIHRYFSKFELTEAGWPHWHLGLDCREYIDNDQLCETWGLGFTKTKRVKKERDFKYLFKYVVKGNGEIPEWLLDYPKRIRVFQTSVGFYEQPSPASRAKSDAPVGESPTLRQKFREWNRRGQLRFRDASYRASACELLAHYTEIFIQRVENGGRAMDAYHVAVSIEKLEEIVKPWTPKRQRKQPPLKQYPSCLLERFRTECTSSVASPSPRTAAPSPRTEKSVLCL